MFVIWAALPLRSLVTPAAAKTIGGDEDVALALGIEHAAGELD
ncbi:hypothetical protein [Novosphingobium sp. 9U]|nr:hypothetical protein [Novosphingobium sp. 9U]